MPGGSGEPGARPPTEGSSRAAARVDSLPRGSARFPPRHEGGSEGRPAGDRVVGSRSDAVPAVDLRRRPRAALCLRPLRPGAAPLARSAPAPPRLREAVPSGEGQRSAPGPTSGSGSWLQAPGARGLRPPHPCPVRAEWVRSLSAHRALCARIESSTLVCCVHIAPCEPSAPEPLRGAIPRSCPAPGPAPGRARSGVAWLPAPTPSRHVDFLFLASWGGSFSRRRQL
nr:uncharacterized protein LOC132594500 [Globicephala melas]XP_060148233.1 uncharacterized protein LOC132594500 [Globicephala melas]